MKTILAELDRMATKGQLGIAGLVSIFDSRNTLRPTRSGDPPDSLPYPTLRQVPGAGIEPAWDISRGILSPLRLPFRHPGGTPYHKGSVLFCNRGWIPTVRI